ncbi:MAG: D-hexose-6-phosphate mutarotase [Hyphomicrobiaceae bacterium]|nr:D-hexose-6-phosphate mutarotase [Hyphomicrobiaceae bacterium]
MPSPPLRDHTQLTARFAVPGRIAIEASPLGGPVVRLIHGEQQALIALHGAQVLNWTIRGQGLLWLSPVARIRDGKGIRGGIPVCWPWFADHPTDVGKPAHGFVRHRSWEMVAAKAEALSTSVVLAAPTVLADAAMWPHDAEARLTVSLGQSLGLALETVNTGSRSFSITEALHTYFRVSDIANAEIAGLDGCTYLDKLEAFARKRQSGAVHIDAEVDRIYLGDTAALELYDKGTRRRVLIESTGSRSAVVWNPWTAKTARLGDMGSPDAFRQMLCIETANAGDDVVTLPQGGRHELGVTYRCLLAD